jgi:putative ABC transport system permease protein
MQLTDDLRFALRYLRHRPGFAVAALLTLTLSIGAATAVFSLVYGVLLRPLDLPQPERLVMLYLDLRAAGGLPQDVGNVATLQDWREQAHSFTGIAGSLNNASAQVALATGGAAQAVGYGRVTAGYFDVLGVRPLRGRGFLPAEEVEGQDRVVVLSHQLWQRDFAGDPGVLGREVRVGAAPRTVVGIMPRGFRDPLVPAAALWVPLSLAPGENDRSGNYVRVIGRLRDGVSLTQAEAELAGIMRGLDAQFHAAYLGAGVSLAPLHRVLVGDVRAPGIALFAAVLLVLLIACVNLANLLLARASERTREIAVRTALGAGRGRLARQLLVESLVLAAVGGAAGAAAGAGMLRLLVRLAPVGMPRLDEVALHGPVLGFAALATLGVGLFFGLVPAAGASRVEPAVALREGGRGMVSGRGALRRGLVIAEVAVCLPLLLGAGLLLRTIAALGAVDPGFDTHGLVAVQVVLPPERYPEREDVLPASAALEERLRALPGVRSVATASVLPLTDHWTDVGVRFEGVANDKPPSVQYSGITPGYFATFGLPLRTGRDFEARDDPDAPRVVVVNEAFAHRFLRGDPLGQRIRLGGAPDAPWRTIVGVSAALHHGGLAQAPEPQIYIPQRQAGFNNLHLLLRYDGDPGALLPAIRRAVREVDPDVPVMRLRTGDELVAGQLAMSRFVGVLLGGFAAVALALALVGVYGVMSYLVSQRRREMGVRLAMGARPRAVLALVLRETALLAAVGVAFGGVLAVLLARGLQTLLFGVRAADPATLAAGAGLMFVAALLATAGPARRAAGLDPLRALRED